MKAKQEGRMNMVSYEFYFDNGDNGAGRASLIDESNLIGILTERRKDRRRVTQNSIMKWGKLAAGVNVDPNCIYYVKIEV